MSIIPFIISFILSAFLHSFIQKVFIHFKKFDDFNHRSSHKTLATRTGGIGIFISTLTISLFYYFNGVEIFDYSLFKIIFLTLDIIFNLSFIFLDPFISSGSL